MSTGLAAFHEVFCFIFSLNSVIIFYITYDSDLIATDTVFNDLFLLSSCLYVVKDFCYTFLFLLHCGQRI